MKQAVESFWIGDENGVETFVAKGKVFADTHPIARAAPLHFEELALDEPPADSGKRGRTTKGA